MRKSRTYAVRSGKLAPLPQAYVTPADPCGLRRVLCSTVESFVPPGIYMGVISDWDFWKAAARLTFVRQPFPPQKPFMEIRGQEFDHRCSLHSIKNARTANRHPRVVFLSSLLFF